MDETEINAELLQVITLLHKKRKKPSTYTQLATNISSYNQLQDFNKMYRE